VELTRSGGHLDFCRFGHAAGRSRVRLMRWRLPNAMDVDCGIVAGPPTLTERQIDRVPPRRRCVGPRAAMAVICW
jgi:hypothetical protein